MSVKASHLLIKHTESRRLASWKDPEGVEIKGRSKSQAVDILKKLLSQIKDGADFGELAKVHSDCGSAQNGGDLGFFSRGQMQKPFEDAVYSMTVGQISEIVHTDSGSHIILRTV